MPHALVTNDLSVKRYDLSIKKADKLNFVEVSGKRNKSCFNVRTGKIIKDLVILKLSDEHLIQQGQFMLTFPRKMHYPHLP